MTDYKKLCKDLRNTEGGSELDCEIHELRPVLRDAANAIEELQAKNKHMNDLLDSALIDRDWP